MAELASIERLNAIEWVPRACAAGKKIIKSKWVYKRKPDRYKARLVAKGFMQSPLDYGLRCTSTPWGFVTPQNLARVDRPVS